jgi:hypothetical protein
VGEFFIELRRHLGDAAYLEFARRNADDLLRRGTSSDGGMKWVQAENRVSPDEVMAQTGLMQGAAGVGSFFLHLDGAERGRAPAIVLPDSPFVS